MPISNWQCAMYKTKHFVQWQKLNNTSDPVEDRTTADNVDNIVNASTSIWLTDNDNIIANASTSVQHGESISNQTTAQPCSEPISVNQYLCNQDSIFISQQD